MANDLDTQPSDLTELPRHADRMTKIDRYDTRGDIREHWTLDGRRTICGLSIGFAQSQPPCGNRPCKRCEKIAERLSEKTASGVTALNPTSERP